MFLLLLLRVTPPSLLPSTLLELQHRLSPVRTRTLHLDLVAQLLDLGAQLRDHWSSWASTPSRATVTRVSQPWRAASCSPRAAAMVPGSAMFCYSLLAASTTVADIKATSPSPFPQAQRRVGLPPACGPQAS